MVLYVVVGNRSTGLVVAPSLKIESMSKAMVFPFSAT
jgi:hypothetical protein